MALLERALDHGNAGHLLHSLPATEVEKEMLRPLNLLTAKPRLYLVNVGEEDLPPRGLALEEVHRHERTG